MHHSYPKISIVIPSYNQGRFLLDAIQSIIQQSYPEKELIIIDGGSTDETLNIIKDYRSHIAYWISEKDSGQSEAIRKGFDVATGEWFNWINSDDALLPGALSAIAEAINNTPRCDIIFGQGVYGHEDGTIFRAFSPLPRIFWIMRYFCLGNICQQATFFSRRAYNSVNGINTSLFYRMDIDLYERILEAGFKGLTLYHPLGFFRIHNNSKTTLHQNLRLQEVRARDKCHGVFQIERKLFRFLKEFLVHCSGSSIKAYFTMRSLREKNLHDLWVNSWHSKRSDEAIRIL